MAKEIRVPHQALRDSRTCSREIEQAFEREGLNVHRHEIVTMEDDHDRGERVIRIQTPRVMVGFGKRG